MYLQALGSNGSGQLGLGHKDDVSAPKPVILPTSLTTADTTNTTQPTIQRIVAGGNHTLLLLSTGDLLWSGDHTSGACGRVTTTTAAPELAPTFRPVALHSLPQGTKPRLIAAAWTASILVISPPPFPPRPPNNNSTPTPPTADRVYSFGTATKGELGLGASTTTAPDPTPIPNFPPAGAQIVDIAACMGHVVAVLSNGEAWGWGNGLKGQLGEPAAGAVCSPRRIEGVGFRVARAVCGREFTCLFGPSETGELVVLGSDKWGVRAQAPERVGGWKEVGAGWGSVFVLKDDGTLLSWGRDDHGQLARGDIGRVRHIAVGSEHTLALTEAGDLMVWGWGEHGNCGPIRDNTGEKGRRNRIASNEDGNEITMIGAGCATSWIATRNPT